MPRYARRQVERREDPEMRTPVSALNNGLAISPLTSFQLKAARARTGLTILLASSLLAFAGCGGVKASAPASKPPEVEVADVVQKDVPIVSEWTATLDGFVNAQIQPRVAGYLIKQNYKEGSFVHKGQVLFEIDPRPFVAALDQAKGQLAQAEAGLGKAQQDVKRDQPLAEQRAIAQSQFDNDIQAELGAKAGVATAKASMEQAQLNVGFTQVTSLIDGIAGIAQTQIGNLVSN